MKLPDINVWLAVSIKGHLHHEIASAWLEDQKDEDRLIFCRPTQQGYVRLLTTASMMKAHDLEPASNRSAWAAYEEFLADPRISFALEPPGIEDTWKAFALRKTPSPKLWMDAYLAAFAVCSGFQLVTADKGFSQFKGLDVHFL